MKIIVATQISNLYFLRMVSQNILFLLKSQLFRNNASFQQSQRLNITAQQFTVTTQKLNWKISRNIFEKLRIFTREKNGNFTS